MVTSSFKEMNIPRNWNAYQSTLVHDRIGSDTHVNDTPTIPICFETACDVHSPPSTTAFLRWCLSDLCRICICNLTPTVIHLKSATFPARQLALVVKVVRSYSPEAWISSAAMRLRNRTELVASDGLCRSFLLQVLNDVRISLYCGGLFQNDYPQYYLPVKNILTKA